MRKKYTPLYERELINFDYKEDQKKMLVLFGLALALGTGAFVEYWMRNIDKAYNEERRFFEETL